LDFWINWMFWIYLDIITRIVSSVNELFERLNGFIHTAE
jgi:hypothetical protein